jgi:DNA-binding transcriptional ArsR family regulator
MEKELMLLRSKLRIQILQKLEYEELTPIMLSKLLKKPRASISRTIIELSKVGYVICITPKKDRWRVYRITTEGKNALRAIDRFI